MSQSDFGTIDAATKSGTQLASDLNSWRTAVHSGHSGTTRPSYAVAGMTWTNTATNPYVVYFYDGTDDIAIGTINTTTNVFTPAGISAGTSGGTATAFTYTPAIPSTGNLANQEYDITFHTAAGTTPTLSVSGQTALAIKYRDTTGALQAITAGTTPSGWRSRVVNDGAYWVQREVAPGVDITILGALTSINNPSVQLIGGGSAAAPSGTGNSYSLKATARVTGEILLDALNGTTSSAWLSMRTYNNGTYHKPMSFLTDGRALVETGIAFPATQVPSSDANTLDDYEEGTWSPVANSFGGTGITTTGHYVKIGGWVFIRATVAGTNLAMTAGTSYLSGLPFQPSGDWTAQWASSNTGVNFGSAYVTTTGAPVVYTPNQAATGSTMIMTAAFRV